MHVSLPLGHYIPHFTHHVPVAKTTSALAVSDAAAIAAMTEAVDTGRASRRLRWWVAGLCALLLIAGGANALLRYRRHVQANLLKRADARVAAVSSTPVKDSERKPLAVTVTV